VSYEAFIVGASIPKLLVLLALLSVSLLLLFFSIKEEMMTLKDEYNLHVISHYKTSAKGVSWHLYFCIFYTCFNPSLSQWFCESGITLGWNPKTCSCILFVYVNCTGLWLSHHSSNYYCKGASKLCANFMSALQINAITTDFVTSDSISCCPNLLYNYLEVLFEIVLAILMQKRDMTFLIYRNKSLSDLCKF